MRIESSHKHRAVAFDLSSNEPLQLAVSLNEQPDSLAEQTAGRVEIAFKAAGDLLNDLALVPGERMTKVLDEAVTLLTHLLGVYAALGLTKRDRAFLIADTAKSWRSRPPAYPDSSSHSSRSSMCR